MRTSPVAVLLIAGALACGSADDGRSPLEAPRAVQLAGAAVPGLVAFTDWGAGQSDVFVLERGTGAILDLPGVNLPTSNEHSTSLGGEGTLLAFGSDRFDGGADVTNVFLYDLLAKAFVRLPRAVSSTGAAEFNPAISRDGRWLVFGSDRTGVGDLFLFDLRRSRLVRLPGLNTETFLEDDPAVSRHGRFIAFFSDREGGGNVYLYDRSLSRLVDLPGLNTDEFVERSPSLSGNGRWLAFLSFRNASTDVFLYDRLSSTLVDLPGLNADDAIDAEPSVSADGRWIVFVRGDAGARDLAVYDRRTQSVRVVDVLGSDEDDPSIE